jgi:protein tyrosine/serine phosphatase
MLVDPARLPALLHCLDGGVVTGVAVMCLRKLQGWSWAALTEESRR